MKKQREMLPSHSTVKSESSISYILEGSIWQLLTTVASKLPSSKIQTANVGNPKEGFCISKWADILV